MTFPQFQLPISLQNSVAKGLFLACHPFLSTEVQKTESTRIKVAFSGSHLDCYHNINSVLCLSIKRLEMQRWILWILWISWILWILWWWFKWSFTFVRRCELWICEFFFSNMRAKCQNIPWWVWFLQNLGSHWNNRHWWCRVDENLPGPGKYQCGSISSSICSSWSLEGVVSVENVGQGFTLPMSVYTVVPTGVSSYTCKHNHLTLYQYKKKHMCFKMQRTMHGWMLCD